MALILPIVPRLSSSTIFYQFYPLDLGVSNVPISVIWALARVGRRRLCTMVVASAQASLVRPTCARPPHRTSLNSPSSMATMTIGHGVFVGGLATIVRTHCRCRTTTLIQLSDAAHIVDDSFFIILFNMKQSRRVGCFIDNRRWKKKLQLGTKKRRKMQLCPYILHKGPQKKI
jgi:hypothetical protein